MKRAEDFYIKLEKRAYQTIDKIESGRDQSAKYEYLEIMTMVAFFLLDSLRTIRFTLCFMAGLLIYKLLFG